MIGPALVPAGSDLAIGLAVGIPVAVVAGGIAVGVRLRRRAPSGPEAVSAPAEAPAPPATAVTTTPTVEAPAEAPPAPEAPAAEAPEAPAAEAPEAPTPEAPAAEAPEAPTPEAAPPEAPVEAPAEAVTYRNRLGKARGLISGYLGSIRSKGRVDAATWDDLEEALIRADVGVSSTDTLLDDLRTRVSSGEIKGPDALLEALKDDLVAMLATADGSLAAPEPDGDGRVDVWLFVGVNGVGKTTTVGKVAKRLAAGGDRVLLAAADTFRAAAGEQLSTWATRTGSDIVRGSEGGDPGSVVFDAVQRAASKGHAIVLADTAGRLHNKVNLIEELKKVRRVADRPPGRVTEVLLVLDATTGQNGLAQAKVFLEAVEVSGVVLTKLDGTAKGGIVVAIERELGLPVKLVGLGEGVDDLVDFDPAAFVDALF